MVSELQDATWLIIGALVLAAVLSLVWVSLLPYVGPCLIWGSLGFTVTALFGASFYLLRMAWNSGSATSSYQGQLTLGMGMAIGIVALCVVALACCMCSRIQ